jgi:hypothetical protein
MKNVGFIILFINLFSISGFSLCKAEPTIETTGKIVLTKSFEAKDVPSNGQFASLTNEFLLTLDANAKGSSWGLKGAESPVLTVFVDGKYNQDLMLFAGAERFTYQISLGKYEKGEHTLVIVLNKTRSALNSKNVKIYSQKIFAAKSLAKDNEQDLAAIANSPILYARPNAIGKFTDIPLITYYEILPVNENHFKIRYTTIFTNEDGGTRTAALMARWGRPTDIEWVYEIEIKDDKIVSETYQGANHETKNFKGNRIFGNHPLIYTVTDNNNFSDTGCSALRSSMLPIKADLSRKSRETVMDENPWTYRVMAEEAIRENRINPQQLDVSTIDNLQNYLYVEIYSENDSATVAVEAQTTDGKTSRSDFGDARLRADRSGYKRIAVKLPSPNSPLKALSIICQKTSDAQSSSDCRNTQIIKFVRLDEKYRLRNITNPKDEIRSLKSGEKLSWQLQGSTQS